MIRVPCLRTEHLTTSNGEVRWQNGLRRGSAAARLMGSGVRIPPESWMSFSCGCYVLSGRCFCVVPITRPVETYRVCCICVCDRETSTMRPRHAEGIEP
jgi:hypothetical protein